VESRYFTTLNSRRILAYFRELHQQDTHRHVSSLLATPHTWYTFLPLAPVRSAQGL
jgi:hypothetical protein